MASLDKRTPLTIKAFLELKACIVPIDVSFLLCLDVFIEISQMAKYENQTLYAKNDS